MDIPFNTEHDPNITFASEEWRYNKTSDRVISDKCLSVCDKNCFNEYFTPNVIARWARDVVDENLDEILIYMPTGLKTQYIHSPRLHLIEYICYTASVLSLWFGFSMTTLLKVLIAIYNSYKNKRRSKIESIDNIEDNPFRVTKV